MKTIATIGIPIVSAVIVAIWTTAVLTEQAAANKAMHAETKQELKELGAKVDALAMDFKVVHSQVMGSKPMTM